MKQGSTDDPFAEDAPDAIGEAPSSDRSETENSSDSSITTEHTIPSQQERSLPYIHARDGVKDGRTQRPVFLREETEAGIDELVAEMEAEFGEDVYKTDVTEAAMIVAQENPDLVAETLDEWGYGWR
jgi:hypothetical protein